MTTFFIMVVLGSWYRSTQLLYGECPGHNEFHEKKTEAPIEFTISMSTDQ